MFMNVVFLKTKMLHFIRTSSDVRKTPPVICANWVVVELTAFVSNGWLKTAQKSLQLMDVFLKKCYNLVKVHLFVMLQRPKVTSFAWLAVGKPMDATAISA